MLRLFQWMALGLLLGVQGPGAVEASDKQLDDIVPKRLKVSLGTDHIFVVTQIHVRPSDLGEDSWSSWDRDASGDLTEPEVQALIQQVRRANLPSQRLAIGGYLLDWAALPATWVAVPGVPLGLNDLLRLRVTGDVPRKKSLQAREVFVVYAPPRAADGIVPLRINLGDGLRFVGVAGARAEQRGPRRIEAVLSRHTPALWGGVARDNLP